MSITYPPEMLPQGDGDGQVIVCSNLSCCLKPETERLRAALAEMRERDDRNGSLPAAYRAIIDRALGEVNAGV